MNKIINKSVKIITFIKGLTYDALFVASSNAIITPFFNYFDFYYLYKKIMRNKIKKLGKNCKI